MTEKELIKQIKQLKDIKPRAEWVFLAKSQIFDEYSSVIPAKAGIQGKSTSSGFRVKPGMTSWFLGVFAPKKLAYSSATLLFIFVGLVGFAQYTMPGDLLFPIRKISEKSESALTGQTGIQKDVANLNSRINDLAKVAKDGKKDNIFPALSEINENAGILVKNLKESNVEDAQTIKEIAASLKVLADVTGANVTDIPEVNSLYQALVERQIADLEKVTLTEEQEQGLAEVKEMYDREDYMQALEKILILIISN